MSNKISASKKILQDLVLESIENAKSEKDFVPVEPSDTESTTQSTDQDEKELENSLRDLSNHTLSLNLEEFEKTLKLLSEEGVDLDDALWAMMEFMPTVPDDFDENSIYELINALKAKNRTKEAEFIENEAQNEDSPFIEILRILISNNNSQKQSFEESLIRILQEGLPVWIIGAGAWAYRSYKVYKKAKKVKKLRKAQRAAEKARKARARAARAKRRARNRRKKNKGFNRRPKKPNQASKWEKIKKAATAAAVVWSAAYYEDTIKIFRSLLSEFKAIYLERKIQLAYGDNRVEYALVNFDGQGTNTVEFNIIKNYFSLFNHHNIDNVDCAPQSITFGDSSAIPCDDVTLMPEAYGLKPELEKSLSTPSNSPENMLAYLNRYKGSTSQSNRLPFEKDLSSVDKYLKVYKGYKKIFYKHGVDSIVDNNIFISEKNAKRAAEAALANKDAVSISEFISFCIKPVLLSKDLGESRINDKDFWSELYRVEAIGDRVNILEEIQNYKEQFIINYFDRDEQIGQASTDIISVRQNFAAFSAAHQTAMLDKEGGYKAILNCIEDQENNRNSEITQQDDYYLQSGKVRTLVALLAGGVLDQKALEGMSYVLKKAKNKLRPSLGPEDALRGPWGIFLKGVPIYEMAFYIFDPLNILDRKLIISNNLDQIEQLIRKEEKYWNSQEIYEWVARDSTMNQIRGKMESIFDEIESEMNKTIDRFYDVAYDEEGFCQELQDKIEIRKSAWKQSIAFRAEVFKAMAQTEKHDKDPGLDMSGRINEFYIDNENIEYIAGSIPVIKKEILELHKAIAAPETGLFLSGTPMDTPAEFAAKISEPSAIKKKPSQPSTGDKEIDRYIDRERSKGLLNLKMQGGIPEHRNQNTNNTPIKEQNLNLDRGVALGRNDWILTTLDKEMKAEDILDNINHPEISNIEKAFLKAISRAFEIRDFTRSGMKYTEKRLKNISKFKTREPYKKGGDSPFATDASDEQTKRFAAVSTDVDIDSIILKGYKTFDSTFKLHDSIGGQPGCFIQLEGHGQDKGGLWGVKNNMGGILFTNLPVGFSLRSRDSLTIPYIKLLNSRSNSVSVSYSYKKNMEQLSNLMANKISPTKKYKVIYDPADVEIRTLNKKEVVNNEIKEVPDSDFLLNTSYINGSDKQPVIDILVDKYTVPPISDRVNLDFVDLPDSAMDKFDEISKKCSRLAINTLSELSAKDADYWNDNERGRELIRVLKIADASEWLDNNETLARVMFNLCNAYDQISKVYLSFKNLKLRQIKNEWGKLIGTYGVNTSELTTIEDKINTIEPLYFARPVGLPASGEEKDRVYRQDTDAEISGVKLTSPETDMKQIKKVDQIAAARWMDRTDVDAVIKKNLSAYNSLIATMNKIKGKPPLITGKLERDRQVIGPLILRIAESIEIENALAENGFYFREFIRLAVKLNN